MIHLHLLSVTTLVVSLCFPIAALAATPPMSDEQLEARADLIITGKVYVVEKDGEVIMDHCYMWQSWSAIFAVDDTIKGKVRKTVTIRYNERIGDADPSHRCVGGDDSFSLQAGKRYKLYLRTEGDEARPFHRNGVKPL